MAYIQPEIKEGYNSYQSVEGNPEVGMDVGLLALRAGEAYTSGQAGREVALLLLQGRALLAWDGQQAEVSRRDTFHEEGSCLHLPGGVPYTVEALSDCEFYVQAADNPARFSPRLYRPAEVMVQHAGAKNELLGAMRRDIKTFFDYESAPWSNMVLGEVLNFPGKWSSYPPHHHPQPEVYFHRFDYPNGFGASFANGEVYTSRHNGLTVILDGFHSQTAAPGYAMCYVWGIRHLEGNPWQKTRIDDPGHEWLWQKDANEHIFQTEAQQ